MTQTANPLPGVGRSLPARDRTPRSAKLRAALAGLVSLATAALLVVGCGGAPGPAATTPAVATATLTPSPTPFPTPRCVEPSLALGAARYRVRTISPAADGSISVPADTAGIAYWVEGTNVRYLFALSPSAENLALRDSLQAGEPAVITWADCMTDTYQVEAFESIVPDMASLLDQSSGGLVAYAGEPGGSGLVVWAARATPVVQETEDAAEDGAVQANLALIETTVSADGSTVTMGVTITNTGSISLAVTEADFSLTPEGGAPQPPLNVAPPLPQEIQPGAGVTFQISFAHPGTMVALLRILDITLEQYY